MMPPRASVGTVSGRPRLIRIFTEITVQQRTINILICLMRLRCAAAFNWNVLLRRGPTKKRSVEFIQNARRDVMLTMLSLCAEKLFQGSTCQRICSTFLRSKT